MQRPRKGAGGKHKAMGKTLRQNSEQQAATESGLGAGNEGRRTGCKGRQGAVGSEAAARHEEVAAGAKHKVMLHACGRRSQRQQQQNPRAVGGVNCHCYINPSVGM